MFPKISPKDTTAWQQLQQHYDTEIKGMHLRSIFKSDPERFSRYSLRLDDILFDFSKNIVTDKTLGLLQQLAAESKVKEAIVQWQASVKEWEASSPADLEPAELAKVKNKLEGAKVRLAKEGSNPNKN